MAPGDQIVPGGWWQMRNLIRCWGWRFWLNLLDRIFAKTRQYNEHESAKIEASLRRGLRGAWVWSSLVKKKFEKVWSRRESLINIKNLLYSTGNCIQCPMINHNGKDYEKEHVYCVQSLSCVWLFAMPWTAACQAPLSSSISWLLLLLSHFSRVWLCVTP